MPNYKPLRNAISLGKPPFVFTITEFGTREAITMNVNYARGTGFVSFHRGFTNYKVQANHKFVCCSLTLHTTGVECVGKIQSHTSADADGTDIFTFSLPAGEFRVDFPLYIETSQNLYITLQASNPTIEQAWITGFEEAT